MKRAYSYVRFSTAEQLKGKSLERQTEAARAYCTQHGLELDTELSLHDLGVSAFRGKNADIGALGSFLRAVAAGQVPKGSYLLIETFDRMSRESAYDAQLTLQNIINQGITVVTLMDGKKYSVEILRSNPISLIEAVLYMMRSHEESATKSKRVADAWRRKRTDLKSGKRLTTIAPGWIEFKDNKPRVIPARGKVVQRIFDMFLDGEGRNSIATALNKDHVPTFGGGQWWTGAYVRMVLRNRAVIGEFQPHRIDHSNPTRKRVRVPDGDPIKHYWPTILDARTFSKAQQRLVKMRGTRAVRSSGLQNILAGLARCPACGGLMERRKNRSAIVCARARAAAGCKYRDVSSAAVEAALLAGAATLASGAPDMTAELTGEVTRLEGQRDALRRQIEDMGMILVDTPSRTIAAKLQAAETELEGLQASIDRVNQQIYYGGARRARDAVTRMRSALQWHAVQPTDIVGVNTALRECFEQIVIDYDKQQLMLYWRHGQTTALPY